MQVVALLALTQLDPAWSITASVVFVMLVQGLSGVAKDLAKMSSKSAVKILAPTTGGGLVPVGGSSDGIKECREGKRLSIGGGLAGRLRVRAFGADDGGGPVCHPDRCRDRHAKGPAGRAQGCEVFGSVFQEPQHQLAQRCTAVPVRGAGRVVRGRHPDLFLRGAVGRQHRGQSHGLLHDRNVHGRLDDPLWRRPRLGTAHPEGGVADRRADYWHWQNGGLVC